MTGKGQDTEHLAFRLHPQAVICGRVTDEHGEVVRSAQVVLFASDLMRGSHAKFMQAETQTNDLGEYRFAHLAPDKYYLAVQARPWYAQPQVSAQMGHHRSVGNGGPAFFASGPGVASDPILDVVYPITFYPGVTDEGSSAGLVLSAGEKQLVSLARAALADPALLVLDEATSSLDPGTELLVEEALERLMVGRTVVVIAHRLSTAERADRIGVVDAGGLVELGTHDDLLQQQGRYAALYSTWAGRLEVAR